MLMIGINNLKKYFGDRLILDIEEVSIFAGDKIGLVGVNGVGKTTLLEIINGDIDQLEGEVYINPGKRLEYVSQLGDPIDEHLNGKYASIFQVDSNWYQDMSGGEKTRYKLAAAISKNPDILLADEPTSNLDLEAVDLIIDIFKDFNKTLLVVSHDRSFLDDVCNKIMEIDRGRVKIYNGNYSKYLELKKAELDRKEFEYREYINEKNRLTNLKENVENRSSKVRTAPKRMGNSEARLHKMGGQVNKAKLDKTAKAIESRIEHLEVKEKPREEEIIRINILENTKPYSKILISGNGINKSFSDNTIFNKASFSIYNGRKIGLIGKNGSGKTTLLKMILNEEDIEIAHNVRIGYFSQSMNILDEGKSVLENVMENSIHDENFARLILARLLFRGNDVYKKVSFLSGGEKVKLSLAKIILEDFNFLILDEPTNYLDLASLEVIEELLMNYNGSILLVSHDRKFVENIAEELLLIENEEIISFKGSYKDYLSSKNEIKFDKEEKVQEENISILEMEISMLLSQISLETNEDTKKELDKLYLERLKELRNMKK